MSPPVGGGGGWNWPPVQHQSPPLWRAEEKGPDGGRGRPGQGGPHAETPSLLLTNTAVDNLSLGGRAPAPRGSGRRTREDGNNNKKKQIQKRLIFSKYFTSQTLKKKKETKQDSPTRSGI